MRKIIIIAPHPDDEVFAIKKVKAIKNINDSVSILFLSGSTLRLNEAKESCKYLGFEYLTMQRTEQDLLQDGLFHEKFKALITVLERLCEGFNLVLSPAIEGGHQDHDTTSLALLCSLETFKRNNTQIYFYPCYTSWKETFLYKANSRSTYLNDLMVPSKINITNSCIREEMHLAYCIYKTQLKTWLFLYPVMLVRYLMRRPEIIYKVNENAYHQGLNIMNSFKQRPLYEIHGRLKLKAWKQYAKSTLNNDFL